MAVSGDSGSLVGPHPEHSTYKGGSTKNEEAVYYGPLRGIPLIRSSLGAEMRGHLDYLSDVGSPVMAKRPSFGSIDLTIRE